MKHYIHVIPTDKPSRLYLGNNGNFVLGMMQTSIQSKNDDFTNQNIYITSDEEIKGGEWCFEVYNGDSWATSPKFIDDEGNTWWLRKANATDIAGCPTTKKIILTTDTNLITNGVQKIDDEFLEWFVKNTSCEKVEIKIKSDLDKVDGHYHDLWEIIIPKEEPKQDKIMERFIANAKQETLEKEPNFYEKLVEYFKNTPREKVLEDWNKTAECDNIGQTMEEFLGNKQETLEEAMEKYLDSPLPHSYRLAVEFGAKWQQETYHQFTLAMDDLKSSREGYLKAKLEYELKQQQGYSEEEMKSAFKIGFSIGYGSPVNGLDSKEETCDVWFEQFKKK